MKPILYLFPIALLAFGCSSVKAPKGYGVNFADFEAELIARHCYEGMPRVKRQPFDIDRGEPAFIVRDGYVLNHSSELKIASWVCERVTADQLEGDAERVDDFAPDPFLAKGRRAELADYRGSGLDRGHMAAAGNQGSAAMKAETFFLSNMAPQVPDFNRGIWRQLENQVRRWAWEYGEVWVITGGFFFEESEAEGRGNGEVRFKKIGDNRVAVPTHFFKIVIRRGPEAVAFVLRNRGVRSSARLERMVKSVRWVETWTGLDFMPDLPPGAANGIEDREALLRSEDGELVWED